ncbi:MAG: DUF5615 family PIN-like protein [Pyrinomonadaceae bacterium]|nr:DUF5615 family PIN-like protein [Pyrinomonadaceae bacterium]
MKIRFQADADLSENIVWAVRRAEPLIDFQKANEANLHGLGDDIVLALAASENRILISHDRRTMPFHFGEFIQQQNSPGVFIVRKRFEMPKVVEAIVLVWSASEAEEWINNISVLPFPSTTE